MSFVLTYCTNLDIQAHLPITLSTDSRPRLEDVEYFRQQVYDMINERLNGRQADRGGLKILEVNKVLEMIDNYYARGRGERTSMVVIDEDDLTSLRLNQGTSGTGYGGGHYSVDIP